MTYTKSFSETIYYGYRFRNNGSTWASASTSADLTGTRTGTKVSDWREKVRTGRDASSPFSSDRNELLSMSEGFGAFSAKSGASSLTQDCTGFFQTGPGVTVTHLNTGTNEAEATALQKTYAKLRSEYQRLNSAAVVAEGLDVMRQFGRPAEAILELTNRHINRLYLEGRGLKGSTAFRRIQFAQILARTWLEYSFGLAPLIADSVAVAEALARWNEEVADPETSGDRLRSRISSRGTQELSSLSSGGYQPIANCHLRYGLRTKKDTSYRVQYVCGLNSSHIADSGSNDRLIQLLGFKPENWVPGIWEWVPWSWLADYFTNIGQILNASVTSTAGVSWVCKTVSQETFQHVTAPVDPEATRNRLALYGWTMQSCSGNLGQYSRRRTTVTRTAGVSLGLPPLTVSCPAIGDAKKWLNMGAVLLARKRESNAALWLF